MEPIIFKELEHFPLGEANIESTDASLTVSNITGSGLDGVFINTKGFNSWHAKFEPIEINEDASVRCVYIAEDGNGNTFTESEFIMTPSVDSDEKIIEGNSGLLTDPYKVEIFRGNEVVYQANYPTPTSSDIWVLLAFYVAAHTSIRFESTVSITTNPDGSTTTTSTTTKKFNWNDTSRIKPASGSEVEGDIIGVTSERKFSDINQGYKIIGVQIYCKNIETLTILNEIITTDN